MNQHQATLKCITQVLLKPEDDLHELKQAIDDLYQLFLDISGIEEHSNASREDVPLAQGKAIGPIWAALCIKEMMRTKRFVRGLYLGVRAAMERFPKRPIHILYAGTGPFASLALPLTTVFRSDEIRFTMLEINAHSIQMLQKVITALEVEQYIAELVQCDATQYESDLTNPVHILVTETMQNALQKEPHVGITLNLVSQLAEGGILIPQDIIIEAALLDPQKDIDRMLGRIEPEDRCYHLLGPVFTLNQHTAQTYTAPDAPGVYNFPEVEIVLPADIPPSYQQLCLFTTIQTFGEETLSYWQCSLNQPQRLQTLSQDMRGSRIRFQYQLTNKPGFTWELFVD